VKKVLFYRFNAPADSTNKQLLGAIELSGISFIKAVDLEGAKASACINSGVIHQKCTFKA
jgi:hypothetical protein